MLKKAFIFITAISFYSCSQQKEAADLIIQNAVIYSVDSAFTIYEAMAIKDGLITGLGTNQEIIENFTADEVSDLQGKAVFPGFIDAHCHFLSYGLGLSKIDLVGTRSFNEVIERVVSSSKKTFPNMDGKKTLPSASSTSAWLLGRGWDQNDWDQKDMPTKEKLDSLFPQRPVLLTRIDGHAALVNSEALKQAGITPTTKISGGEVVKNGNKLTGLLIDNAIDLVKSKIPTPGKDEKSEALLNAQNNCLEMGLTTVDDAGLMKNDVEIIDALQKSGKLKMRVYAMLSDSLPNYEYYFERGPYKTNRLNVRAFKFYADGALGSRGACLLEDYTDKKDWKGFLLSETVHFEKYARVLVEKGFQMCTHCIGDSAYRVIINTYKKAGVQKDKRWRIEHAQVVHPSDVKISDAVIPSVQPTHATSDMYWAETRLGNERVKTAYAYKDLLNASGIVALGTDFPVEDISPFKTFFAAVARQDSKHYPENGFQKENALTREETLKGMTLWAAYSNFEEKEKGSLEKGKFADFIILDHDIMKCDLKEILTTNVLGTYIGGEKVFGLKK